MRIRELNKIEIETIEKQIRGLKDDSYYKYYFTENEVVNTPDRAFMLDGSYYVDFTFYDDVCYMGVLNLDKQTKANSYYSLIKLFKEMLKHYKRIIQFCKLDNDIALRFHNLLIKKFNAKQEIINNYSIVEVNNEEFEREI